MQEEKYWRRFVSCGRIDDYLKYTAAKRAREMSEGRGNAFNDRGAGDKGINRGGERPPYNAPYS